MRDAAWLMALLLALLAIGCISPESVTPTDPLPPVPESVVRTEPKADVQPPARVPTPTTTVKPVSARSPAKTIKGLRILVDAGHGGKDPGASGLSPVFEKSIALSMAQEVAKRLKARGARVEMTRTSDVFIELNDRARKADRVRCDLFVSLHADAAGSSSASGVGLFVARSALEKSRRTAQSILNAVRKAGLQTRSLQRKNFRVLVGHRRPAVLVECGFLTNSRDARNLNSSRYRGKLADAIVVGIVDALGI